MKNFKRVFKLWNFNHKSKVTEEPEMLEITKQYIAYCANSNT